MIKKVKSYLKLMRIKHYLKNCLVLFPLIFSINLFKIDYLIKSLGGFLMFCLVSSIVYTINDIKDVEKDRLHPKKKKRPIASGSVTIKEAWILVGGLFFCLVGVNLVFKFSINSVLLLCLYLVINLFYSFGFKNIPLLDLVILVLGFLIRIIFGASIILVPVSNWLYLTIMSGAFYLALGKRRNEFIKSNSLTRNVLKYYSREFLDKNMYLCLGLAITFYSLWTVDSSSLNDNLVWTVPLLIVICMRYNMIVESDDFGDPVEVILHDKWLMLFICGYALVLFCLIYFWR